MKYNDIKQYSIILAKDYEINSYSGSRKKGERPFLVWFKDDSTKSIYLLPFTTQEKNNLKQIKIPEMPDSYLNIIENRIKVEEKMLKKIKGFEYSRPINETSIKEIENAFRDKNILPFYD